MPAAALRRAGVRRALPPAGLGAWLSDRLRLPPRDGG
jgi:hypothetical protein